MIQSTSWDWSPGRRKVVDLRPWQTENDWVEEPCASPDGEQIAAAANIGESTFSVCVNDSRWESAFEKIWGLRYTADGRLIAVVSQDMEWTLAADDATWDSGYEYAWDVRAPANGGPIACAAKEGVKYFAVTDGTPWETRFSNLTQLTASADGTRTAAAVQTVDFSEGDIETFQKGCYTVAVNGAPWDNTYVNVYDPVFSKDGDHVAATVRRNLYEYTVSVDGHPWAETFSMAWSPQFSLKNGSVTAPVKTPAGWTIATDGHPLWLGRYAQLWGHAYSPDGSRIAAIASQKFGQWTVTVDDKPWTLSFSDWVSDLVFDPDGKRIACIGCRNGVRTIAVDGRAWDITADTLWPPVFSPDGRHVAAKAKVKDGYHVVVDGKIGNERFPWMAEPTFSPDGEHLLMRVISGSPEHRHYERIVIPVGIK